MDIPEVKDIDCVFGNIKHLPKWDDIPKEFKKPDNDWCRIVSKWFHNGGTMESFGIEPKDGIDGGKALRAIGACLRSFEPKHEHKIAGCGLMLSEWFNIKNSGKRNG